MDGIERIAARIREDADQEIARMNQEATEQVEAIQAQAQAQASREREEILARGRRAADERLERLKSAALMQRRTLELGARQEVLAEAFEKALDQLCALPDEKMVSLLASLALQAAPGGRGRLIFSPQGRAQIGAAVVAKANEALAARGAGALALAQETRPLRGGFILADGPVEVNCSFEAMLRLRREALEKPVAEILFGQGKA